MAANFMATSRMNILRLFVNNNLDDMVNWVLINSENHTEGGISTWEEIALFEDAQLEIYLNSQVCSILHTNISGISIKKLTDSLILSILEESIIDDIEDIKPIILRIEDDTAFVAIFNRMYYNNLITKLNSLQKSVRFVQSFVFSTTFLENHWTIFVDKEQSFIRTSLYEYFLLDNNLPISLVLQDMLKKTQPEKIIIYAENPEIIEAIASNTQLPVIVSHEINFGIPIWNFHNQKSTHFHIKLDAVTKNNLLKLYHILKKFTIFIIIFWLINLLILEINVIKTEKQLKTNLNYITSVQNIDADSLQLVDNKIASMKHERALYYENDFIPILNNVLEIISTINTNSIVQIEYSEGNMKIFLNNNFSPSQFFSFKNILLTKRIIASIEDYKFYSKQHKEKTENSDPNNDNHMPDDIAFVLTLHSSFMSELRN